MAQLKDTVVTGNLNVTNEILTNSIQASVVKAPTASCLTTDTTFTQGTLPTIGTAIPADDITSWSAGTLPSLSYTSRSIPNVTSVGTAPSLVTKDTTIYPVTSTTTTATKVVTKTWTIPNVTAVGTTPTLGTEIPADDITSWDAGSLPTATYSAGILTFAAGTLPSLSYTAKSIPNVTAVGTTPTLGTAITVTGVSSNSDVTVPILSSSVSITGVSSWSAGTTPTLGTAISADDITSWDAGTLSSLSYSAKSIPNVTSAGTLPSLTMSSANVVIGTN